jgi:hypothetical protein
LRCGEKMLDGYWLCALCLRLYLARMEAERFA